MIPRLLPLLALVVAAAAADPTALAQPPTPRLLVFRDGALMEWQMELPPGSHRLDLPDRPRGRVQVDGAAWRVEDTDESVAPPQPAALAELCRERNRWAAESNRRTDRATAHAAAERRLRARLPALADQPAPATTTWQQALDALLEESAALTTETARLAALKADLADRATQAVGIQTRATAILALDQPETVPVLTLPAMAAVWAEQARTTVHRRRVVLATAATSPVTVRLHLTQVRWEPAAVLTLAGDKLSLVRQARLTKPADLDLGTLPVRVATAVLTPPLEGPQERPVRGSLRELNAGEGKQVAIGSTSGHWAQARELPALAETPSPTPAAAQDQVQGRSNISSKELRETAVELDEVSPPPSAPTPAGLAETWDLGPVALPKGESQTVCDRPATQPARIADEWALIPAAGPVLIRRLGVKLDDQPLQPGLLTLVVDGLPAGSTTLEAKPAGSVLWLRAGEDPTLFAGEAEPWDLKEEKPTTSHQVSGTTLPIHNLGTAPRQVTIYRTWPLSRSAEITVGLHPKTTPGQQIVEPGVLRWTLTIPAGEAAKLDLGWLVEANGNLNL